VGPLPPPLNPEEELASTALSPTSTLSSATPAAVEQDSPAEEEEEEEEVVPEEEEDGEDVDFPARGKAPKVKPIKPYNPASPIAKGRQAMTNILKKRKYHAFDAPPISVKELWKQVAKKNARFSMEDARDFLLSTDLVKYNPDTRGFEIAKSARNEAVTRRLVEFTRDRLGKQKKGESGKLIRDLFHENGDAYKVTSGPKGALIPSGWLQRMLLLDGGFRMERVGDGPEDVMVYLKEKTPVSAAASSSDAVVPVPVPVPVPVVEEASSEQQQQQPRSRDRRSKNPKRDVREVGSSAAAAEQFVSNETAAAAEDDDSVSPPSAKVARLMVMLKETELRVRAEIEESQRFMEVLDMLSWLVDEFQTKSGDRKLECTIPLTDANRKDQWSRCKQEVIQLLGTTLFSITNITKDGLNMARMKQPAREFANSVHAFIAEHNCGGMNNSANSDPKNNAMAAVCLKLQILAQTVFEYDLSEQFGKVVESVLSRPSILRAFEIDMIEKYNIHEEFWNAFGRKTVTKWLRDADITMVRVTERGLLFSGSGLSLQ
jgi:hypothetical protein